MKYPCDIVSDDHGWHRIYEGHGLDRDMVRNDLERSAGDPRADQDLVAEEVWMIYLPRVKNCERNGYGCDNDGEWHSHWIAARTGHGDPFTIAYWEFREVVRECVGG